MEDTFGGQGQIDQFREVHFQDRQEQFHAGCADVEVFHGRRADDGRRVNGIAPVGDGGDVEGGVEIGQ